MREQLNVVYCSLYNTSSTSHSASEVRFIALYLDYHEQRRQDIVPMDCCTVADSGFELALR